MRRCPECRGFGIIDCPVVAAQAGIPGTRTSTAPTAAAQPPSSATSAAARDGWTMTTIIVPEPTSISEQKAHPRRNPPGVRVVFNFQAFSAM